MRLEGLKVLRWSHGGDGIAIPESGPLEGRVVFVPGGVPGDVVTCEVVAQKRRWARTRLVTVESPAAGRVEPPCEIQGRCGGCPWMVGDRVTQDAARSDVLRGEVRKTLGWAEEEIEARVHVVTDVGEPYGYRARVRMAFRSDGDSRIVLGYRAAGSEALVNAPTCAIASPAIQQRLPSLRGEIASLGRAEGEVLMVAGEEGVASLIRCQDGRQIRLGPERVTVAQGPSRVSIPPEGFVQANPAVAGALVAAVAQRALQAGGGRAVELFAGSGTFTVPLLLAGFEVTAYELATHSREGFERTVGADARAVWHQADLLDVGLPLPAPETPDLVLLDPPRVGAGPLMPWIRGCGAKTVLMVSCDVATAMRDIAVLTKGEGAPLRVESIRSYDMFPHTGHQELLVVMVEA